MSVKQNTASSKVDEDLSDLLDNALEDFGSDTAKKGSITKVDISDESSTKAEEAEEAAVSDKIPQAFIQQAAQQFEDNFAKLLIRADPNVEPSSDVIQERLKQMADAAQQVLTNPTDVSDQSVDFAASISQAIAGINQGQDNTSAPFNEEDFLRMFGSSNQDSTDFLPFMQGMMQGLLSKELLGPSLQDFVQKLPAYLENNKETLSREDADRYDNQRKLMEEVLEELNKEKDTDSTEVKKERFSRVLALMQKLQDYGQPPAELVGEVEAPFTFDPSGTPIDPSGNPECSVM